MPHRYICSVLDEMRECVKTSNFSELVKTNFYKQLLTIKNRLNSKYHQRIEKQSDWISLVKKVNVEIDKALLSLQDGQSFVSSLSWTVTDAA